MLIQPGLPLSYSGLLGSPQQSRFNMCKFLGRQTIAQVIFILYSCLWSCINASVRVLSGFHPWCKNIDISLIRESKLDQIVGLCPVVDWWPTQSASFSRSVGMILWQKIDPYDLIWQYLDFKVIRYQDQFKETHLLQNGKSYFVATIMWHRLFPDCLS